MYKLALYNNNYCWDIRIVLQHGGYECKCTVISNAWYSLNVKWLLSLHRGLAHVPIFYTCTRVVAVCTVKHILVSAVNKYWQLWFWTDQYTATPITTASSKPPIALAVPPIATLREWTHYKLYSNICTTYMSTYQCLLLHLICCVFQYHLCQKHISGDSFS